MVENQVFAIQYIDRDELIVKVVRCKLAKRRRFVASQFV